MFANIQPNQQQQHNLMFQQQQQQQQQQQSTIQSTHDYTSFIHLS